MSDVTEKLAQKADWVEELQRKVFDECIAKSRNLQDQVVDDSETWTDQDVEVDVPVSIIVDNINHSFVGFPHFRQRIDFLEELRQSLQKLERKKCVNWTEFKKSSENWFIKLLNVVQQDGNNNIRLNHSDAPTEDSERDGLSMEEHSDTIDNENTSCSINQLDTIASSYSLNSSSMGFGTTNSTIESSEETDHRENDISRMDLQIRVRRFNEETISLRDDLSRAEDTISTLERSIKSTQLALDHKTNICTQLQKENDDQRELLNDVTQKKKSYKQNLRKLEKAYSTLEKKVTELEQEKENILALKDRIQKLTKENSLLAKQLADYKRKYDEKMVECGSLQEENEELQKKLYQLQQTYDRHVEQLQEKIEELQNINTELQLKMINKSDSSCSRMSLTPPPYNNLNAYIHSTPYNNNKNRHQESLFSELNALGYNADDAKLQELRNELSMYNVEIATMGQQLDDALQNLATARNEIYVPNVQLVEPDSIQNLKHKIISLVERVKSSCIDIKAAPSPAVIAPRMGEDTREKKPDVLPESTKSNYLSDDRLFGSEKLESDLVGSVTSSLTTVDSKLYGKVDRPTSVPPEAASFIAEVPEEESACQSEIIVPITEALSRITDFKGSEDAEPVNPFKSSYSKQRSIFTLKKSMDCMNIEAEASKAPALRKITGDYGRNEVHANVCSDGLRQEFERLGKTDFANTKASIETTTKEKLILQSQLKDNSPSPAISKLDTRYITIRSNEKTFSVLNSVVSSTEEKPVEVVEKNEPLNPLETPYFQTPLRSQINVPRRKASVFKRSFEIDNLQKPDSALNTNNEKKRSVSTPDVQESDNCGFRSNKSVYPFETPVTKKQLQTTYRCANNSDSSCSPSPKKDELFLLTADEESPFRLNEEPKKQSIASKLGKQLIHAAKLNLPDSTRHQSYTMERDEKKTAIPVVCRNAAQEMLQRDSSMRNISHSNIADHSKILSSSPNLGSKVEITATDGLIPTAVTNFSSVSTDCSNVSTTEIVNSENSATSTNISNSGFTPNIVPKNDKTYTTNAVVAEMKKTIAEVSSAPSVSVVREENIVSSCCCSGASGGIDSSSSLVSAVVRAMPSGEDSSVESECDALKALNKSSVAMTVEQKNDVEETSAQSSTVEKPVQKQKKPSLLPLTPQTLNCSVVEVDSNGKPVLGRKRSNSCVETVTSRDIKLVATPTANGVDKNDSCQKNTSNSSSQEAVKEDESPKAFPSWTDDRLQESGIASFPDIDAEISENLSEEEGKKKYTAFSVGLGTDRMTLSKRMILSRRHRDQAEKNFNNEVLKMQQDIKDLAPLCVDTESLERVERAKLQLEMVARCAHRISSNAETLGAVHQERRVSRAVMLADKYLQTLRGKCEKLANELAETKRILAENNIVLEENLSEMGDDVPRVRYRAVPNNNRTMMARRRASIATISRPLMGSNQDITKEPRQRNSVSGRVPGVRRPSLCYENPKWETEKLDRTDSSSSIAELRDIFEQAESRRHSREENNNLIRTSINNLSIITSEHIEEKDVWSNTQDDVVLESVNDDDVNSLELGQNNSHPLLFWLLSRYTVWKPMIWGLLIAFILGIFLDRVVSSSRQNGPPLSWWSIEEILNLYVQVENTNLPAPRPI